MKKHLSLVLAAATLALCAAPVAHAQTAEGWLFHKAGEFTLSPVQLGTSANLGDYGDGRTTFTLFTDFDYHLTPEMAIGALVNVGFGSNLIGFDFGPQFKYKFKLGSSGHVPYARAGIPLRLGVFSSDAFGVGSQTLVGVGVLLGGGYRYWFHRRFAVGADLGLVPTFIVSGPGTFYFGINFQVGVEIKL